MAVLVAVGLLVAVPTTAGAAGPQVYGRVTDASTGSPIRNVRVQLFDANWNYVKQTKAKRNGIYEMSSPGPGTYHLQFVDARPAYDTRAYAARLDVRIKIGSSSKQQNVRLRRGGAIGGVVKVKGRPAPHARIRAISNGGQVITVRADKRGQYALGGLAKDDYRVYAYDAKNRRVGRSKLVRSVKLKTFRKVSFNLKTRPGTIRGFILTGGNRASGTVYVTAVNKKTGEYWVARVTRGNLSLRGLTPGSYRLQVPDTGGYFGSTFNIGYVRAGRTHNTTVNLPTSGGTFSGKAVDATSGAGIPNISVRLTDARGKVQAELPAKQDGSFRIGGNVRPQSGMKITIFAYGKIQGHTYAAEVRYPLSVANNSNQSLGVIKLTRTDPPTPTPTATTPTPSASTPTPTGTTPTPTATTPTPTATTPSPTASTPAP